MRKTYMLCHQSTVSTTPWPPTQCGGDGGEPFTALITTATLTITKKQRKSTSPSRKTGFDSDTALAFRGTIDRSIERASELGVTHSSLARVQRFCKFLNRACRRRVQRRLIRACVAILVAPLPLSRVKTKGTCRYKPRPGERTSF